MGKKSEKGSILLLVIMAVIILSIMGIAGLRVVTPSNPKQAYGLLKAGVRCDDPVLINEHELMYNMKGDVPDEEYFHPLEGSEVTRPGKDVTLFGYNISVHWCWQLMCLPSNTVSMQKWLICFR